MKLKKNWFSYGIWAVLAIFAAISLAVNVIYITASFGFKNVDTEIGFVCLALVFCFAFYELICMIVRYFVSTKVVSDKFKKNLLRVIVGLIFAVSLLSRFSYISLNNFYLTGTDSLYTMSYFSGTQTGETHAILEVIYTSILNFVFSLFGRSTSVALLFQFTLEEFILIAFYILVRKLSSLGTATVFLAIATMLNCFNKKTTVLSVEPLLVLFILIVLILFTCFFQICAKQYEHGFVVEALFALTGGLCGALSAIDILGCAVTFALLTILITETRFSRKKVVENQVLYERMPLYAIYFAVVAVAIFFFTLFLFQKENSNIVNSLQEYYDRFLANAYFKVGAIGFHESTLMGFLISVLGTLWFFSFPTVSYDFARMGTLIWLGTVLIQFLHMNTFEYEVSSSLFSLLFCVGGVYGIFYHQKEFGKYAGKKIIAFEDSPGKNKEEELMLEPEATMGGDENWNQVFPDGRVETEGSQVLYRVPIPEQTDNKKEGTEVLQQADFVEAIVEEKPDELREATMEGKPDELREATMEGKPDGLREATMEGKPDELREATMEGKPDGLREATMEGKPDGLREAIDEEKPVEIHEVAFGEQSAEMHEADFIIHPVEMSEVSFGEHSTEMSEASFEEHPVFMSEVSIEEQTSDSYASDYSDEPVSVSKTTVVEHSVEVEQPLLNKKVIPVIKIPKMIQIPTNKRPELHIDNNEMKENNVLHLKRDMPEVASRVEPPEKSNTPELPPLPKTPVKTPKKRLNFSLEDVDSWDFDIVDIPEDDDFDLK